MAELEHDMQRLIFWGRSDHAYSRNGVVRSVMSQQGLKICDHAPCFWDALGRGSASRLPADAQLVWVPCFRQRDMVTASRFSKRRGLPLVFDPLISAYDKQVFERTKFAEGSVKARQLLAWERKRFALADLVLADTQAHASYFHEVLGVAEDRLAVLPVGADEALFKDMPMQPHEGRRPQVLFFGSFIHLHGPEVIAEAAALCPEADWLLLGDGPCRASAERLARGFSHIKFEPYPGYTNLPARIAGADILLGAFSKSLKAGRVIPNKIYQSLACGRPVLSRDPLPGAFPWPSDPTGMSTGVITVPPEDPRALADAVRRLAADPQSLATIGRAARATFEQHGSFNRINQAFRDIIDRLNLKAEAY